DEVSGSGCPRMVGDLPRLRTLGGATEIQNQYLGSYSQEVRDPSEPKGVLR
ncbi:Hypothetical predicted protein, partial [Marmota monax]